MPFTQMLLLANCASKLATSCLRVRRLCLCLRPKCLLASDSVIPGFSQPLEPSRVYGMKDGDLAREDELHNTVQYRRGTSTTATQPSVGSVMTW